MAHTLVGATLAETGLKRHTPLATATLVLGANAPDIDILAAAWGRDASLYWRRGHTHGVLAVLLLPVLLTGLVVAYDRLLRRRWQKPHDPVRAGPLLALSFLSVWTHPALDWLNNYGVRLLMPFDGRWFYGDSLFIVDPWLWISMTVAVVLARSRGPLSKTAWLVAGLGATSLVMMTGFVPLGAQIAWGVGVAIIVALRSSRHSPAWSHRVALICAGTLLVYLAAMVTGSALARRDAQHWLSEQNIAVDEIYAGPLPANPFVRDVIAQVGHKYYFLERDFLGDPEIGFTDDPATSDPRNDVVEAALDAPAVRGLSNWLRYPSFEVKERAGGGYGVRIRDVRYSRWEQTDLGSRTVELDASLAPH